MKTRNKQLYDKVLKTSKIRKYEQIPLLIIYFRYDSFARDKRKFDSALDTKSS